MLVENWMSKTVVTVGQNESLLDAMRLLEQKAVSMLPVLEGEEVVGIVTDRDVKRALFSDVARPDIPELPFSMSRVKVREFMSRNPITVPFDFTVEETAEILLHNKISGAPVLDHDGKIVGIITQTDIFRALISMTGVGKKGLQFAFQLEDRPGSIREVCDVIRKYGGRMVSILSTYEGIQDGYRKVYIRSCDINKAKLSDIKAELKARAKVFYMVDHGDNRREIYE